MIRNLHIIVASVLLGVGGQLLFKEASKHITVNAVSLHLLWQMITNLYVWLAFVSYGFSTVLWIAVLSRVKLSVAEPMLSMGFVLVVVFSHLLFGEQITFNHWVGVGIITLGIILVGES